MAANLRPTTGTYFNKFLGEILPWEDNRVELAAEKDQHGLPVARVTFNLHDNDKKLIEFGKNKVMEIMAAAGAKQVVQESRFAHLVGGARMGSDPSTSVVDKFGRTDDIPNLFVCDGSILPTQGSANPGLTIQALAARTADYLIRHGDTIFYSNRRELNRRLSDTISVRLTLASRAIHALPDV